MSANQRTEITLLLQRWRKGDRSAESRIFELLLPELKVLARRALRQERRGHSLQPTALVNEAFLRLVAAKSINWNDRGHFLALAATIMRRYLVDRVRSRFKGQLVSWECFPEDVLNHRSSLDLIVEIDRVLYELEEKSPQQRMIVEMKFYLGLTDLEAAHALNLRLRTLQREWHLARAWLFNRLNAKRKI